MLKKLLKRLRTAAEARAKKKLKKKLKKKIRRFFVRLLLLGLAALSGWMLFAHRKLLIAKLLHRDAPKGECPRKRLFGEK